MQVILTEEEYRDLVPRLLYREALTKFLKALQKGTKHHDIYHIPGRSDVWVMRLADYQEAFTQLEAELESYNTDKANPIVDWKKFNRNLNV